MTLSRRQIHIGAEALGLVVAAPFVIWTATRTRPLTGFEKAGLWAIAIGTAIVDGYLLRDYLRSRRG